MITLDDVFSYLLNGGFVLLLNTDFPSFFLEEKQLPFSGIVSSRTWVHVFIFLGRSFCARPLRQRETIKHSFIYGLFILFFRFLSPRWSLPLSLILDPFGSEPLYCGKRRRGPPRSITTAHSSYTYVSYGLSCIFRLLLPSCTKRR